MKKFDKEQYFSMLTFWDNEISRFYSRQNLYLSLQIAAFAGIIAVFEKLTSNLILLIFACIILIFTSFITALIAHRGLNTQKLIVNIILKIEERSEDELDISKLGGKTNYFTNFVYSLVFSYCLFIVWTTFFIWILLSYTA